VTDRRDAQWVRYRRNPALPPEIAAVLAAVLDAAQAGERRIA
jgi:ArsR family transcriptional regulator